MVLSAFGHRVRQLRKKKGLNQTQLAARVGVHYNHLAKYEKGQSYPSVRALMALAESLNVTMDYLMLGTAASSHIGDDELLMLFSELLTLSPKDRIEVKKYLVDFIGEKKGVS